MIQLQVNPRVAERLRNVGDSPDGRVSLTEVVEIQVINDDDPSNHLLTNDTGKSLIIIKLI